MSLTYRRAVRALMGGGGLEINCITEYYTYLLFNCTSNDATKELIVEMHRGDVEAPQSTPPTRRCPGRGCVGEVAGDVRCSKRDRP